MGITRSGDYKRRSTGARQNPIRAKRKFNMGRPPAMTKLQGPKRVRVVRCFNGVRKYRALRLETGNFSWPSEGITRKTRLMDVVYNASNNELERTKTLVKNSIIQIDATPFKQWFETTYNTQVGRKKGDEQQAEAPKAEEPKAAKAEKKEKGAEGAKGKKGKKEKKAKKAPRSFTLDPKLESQFSSGRLYACIASRPGQCGRCDGYILEGKELEFYLRKMKR